MATRLLFERYNGMLVRLRKEYPATCKFVNETNHVENDYIFQLNPLKYFEIPELHLEEIEKILETQKAVIEKISWYEVIAIGSTRRKRIIKSEISFNIWRECDA